MSCCFHQWSLSLMPGEENVSLVSIYGNGPWTNINTLLLSYRGYLPLSILRLLLVIYLYIQCFGDTLPGNPIRNGGSNQSLSCFPPILKVNHPPSETSQFRLPSLGLAAGAPPTIPLSPAIARVNRWSGAAVNS